MSATFEAPPPPHQTHIPTRYGTLSLASSHPVPIAGPAVLFIHGNSSCSRVFHRLWASSQLATPQRVLLAFDLPGHGASTDAPDPEDAYTMPAYARAAALVLRHVQCTEVVVVGWSLGGHIAIEMLDLPPADAHGVNIKGIVLTGTPPTARGRPDDGFHPKPRFLPAAKDFTDEECGQYAAGGVGHVNVEPWMEKAVRRTDGRAREVAWRRWREAYGSDQREVVGREGGPPIAVIDGADENSVRLDYIRTVEFGNLWTGKCIEIQGAKHAPFWEKQEEYLPILCDFLRDCGV